MFHKKQNNESGQLLVILAVALVVLLGFTALAVDGGAILADRRTDQNGADAATLGGVGAVSEYIESNKIYNLNCEDFKNYTDVKLNPDGSVKRPLVQLGINAAISRAANNGFDIDGFVIEANNPLPAGKANVVTYDTTTCESNEIKYPVIISKDVKTSFMHFVFGGLATNKVESTASLLPLHDIGWGYTIVGLKKDCSSSNPTVEFDGNNTVKIGSSSPPKTTGGVFSNGVLDVNGKGSSEFKIEVNGDINYLCNPGGYINPSGAPVSPTPAPASDPFVTPEITPPTCESFVDPPQINKNTPPLKPGSYHGLKVSGAKDILTMGPGLYCFDQDFIVSSGTVTGTGVTIFMTNGASVKINAGTDPKVTPTPIPDSELATVKLSPPTNAVCSPGSNNCSIPKVLIYLAPGNTGSVSLEGNSVSQFDGLVFAPNGSVDVGGNNNSTTTMGISVIAWTVKVHGNVTLNLFTDSGSLPTENSTINLEK